jgi:hypothetical protein
MFLLTSEILGRPPRKFNVLRREFGLRGSRDPSSGMSCPLKTGSYPHLRFRSNSGLRCGNGTYTVPLSEDGSKPDALLQHFFDGLGILHKFRMERGQVFYMSKHNTSGVAERAKKRGFIETHFFGPNPNTPLVEAQDPCYLLYGKQVRVKQLPSHHECSEESEMDMRFKSD